jgi:hypothetical protein
MTSRGPGGSGAEAQGGRCLHLPPSSGRGAADELAAMSQPRAEVTSCRDSMATAATCSDHVTHGVSLERLSPSESPAAIAAGPLGAAGGAAFAGSPGAEGAARSRPRTQPSASRPWQGRQLASRETAPGAILSRYRKTARAARLTPATTNFAASSSTRGASVKASCVRSLGACAVREQPQCASGPWLGGCRRRLWGSRR